MSYFIIMLFVIHFASRWIGRWLGISSPFPSLFRTIKDWVDGHNTWKKYFIGHVIDFTFAGIAWTIVYHIFRWLTT